MYYYWTAYKFKGFLISCKNTKFLIYSKYDINRGKILSCLYWQVLQKLSSLFLFWNLINKVHECIFMREPLPASIPKDNSHCQISEAVSYGYCMLLFVDTDLNEGWAHPPVLYKGQHLAVGHLGPVCCQSRVNDR